MLANISRDLNNLDIVILCHSPNLTGPTQSWKGPKIFSNLLRAQDQQKLAIKLRCHLRLGIDQETLLVFGENDVDPSSDYVYPGQAKGLEAFRKVSCNANFLVLLQKKDFR